MERSIVFDIEQNRRRLQYYSQLKEKSGSNTPLTVSKWIEIYSERMALLEKKAKELGIPLNLQNQAH